MFEIYYCPNCQEMIVSEDEIFCGVCQREYIVVKGELEEQIVNFCERN